MSAHSGTRVALVVGGSRGFGAATALELAGNGYSVDVSFQNSQETADEVVQKINAMGAELLVDGGWSV